MAETPKPNTEETPGEKPGEETPAAGSAAVVGTKPPSKPKPAGVAGDDSKRKLEIRVSELEDENAGLLEEVSKLQKTIKGVASTPKGKGLLDELADWITGKN